ncbi:MAG: prolipoprotein diacylglyceryl transferase [Armatimonadetes bacterium CG_4_10_14_0_8_um_filter_66_14]|nr:prolipoprotein diacylglyceryl transferase [Armatimonadota bacterium]PIZ44887.1 MAG: prolipoprotein diacylglyceryl transferase [Armatimonadetes bacterium CG_4_10_14_0_8_um_filter_66_14]
MKLGWFRVNAYGFLLLIGFAAGTAWAAREARRRDLSPDLIIDYALWALLSAIIGSRIVFVLLDLRSYLQQPETMWQIWKGGLSFHGGLAAALLALHFFCRKRGVRFAQMTDLLAPGLALGYAFARIGCFLNGCCYGVPTHLPWACRFPDEHNLGHLTPPSHPVQLYASLLSLVLFALLVRNLHRARFEGQVTCWYLIGYSVLRFGVEFLRRGVTGKLFIAGLTEAQIASVLMFAFAAVALVIRGRRTAAGDETEKHPTKKHRQRGA